MNLLLSKLLPKRSGIPILLYHKIHARSEGAKTVSSAEFRRQLAWLKSEGYESIRLETFLDVLYGRKTREDLPAKPILLTFDHGYLSTLTIAAPILMEHGFCATLFATSGYVDQKNSSEYMSPACLELWQNAGHDLAMHSHDHLDYRAIENPKILLDLKISLEWFQSKKINATPVLAYPFGEAPKEAGRNEHLKHSLKKKGMVAGFSIGNRIPTWDELQKKQIDPFEIPRIDIHGHDSIQSFSVKVQKGRVRWFQ